MASKRISLIMQGTKDVYFSGDQLRVDSYPHCYVKMGAQWLREVRGVLNSDFQMFSVSPGVSIQLNQLIETMGIATIARRDVYV